MRPAFVYLVIHGRQRLSRRRKKQFKHDYLKIIAAITARKMEKRTGHPAATKLVWKFARRLRTPVSFEP